MYMSLFGTETTSLLFIYLFYNLLLLPEATDVAIVMLDDITDSNTGSRVLLLCDD